MANHPGACCGNSFSSVSLKGNMNIQASIRCSCLVLAGLLLSFLTPSQAAATVVELSYTVAATATDDGPQDGVFDAFAPFNFGSVNNNGYTSFRTALEFDISAVPAGSVINAATLTIVVGFVEGTRQIALNGYSGSGAISLGDFSLNGLVGNATLNPPGPQTVIFDATVFLESLLTSGEAFAGFNVREDPANPSNFTVFNVLDYEPRLSIDFVAQAVPEPSPVSLLGAGLLAILFVKRLRGRRKPLA
jgi:hypothetical protein